jgi:mRNA interferase HicA
VVKRVRPPSSQGGKSLAYAHISVYIVSVRRKTLERLLRELGWRLLRHGGGHDVWTNGTDLEYVPRHQEIHERLAAKILRTAAAAGRKE